MSTKPDQRIVMTLDAGGTSFRFAAMRNYKPVTATVTLPSQGHDLKACLGNIIEGFSRVKAHCPGPPQAISFAFPGPADYPRGIIGDLGNLPSFRGGVALGPMLEHKFRVPVFINNDGDLFVHGEAIAGFLPQVNGLLKQAGSPKQYKNLFGVTLGTGFGGGMTRDGELFVGDNAIGFEVWLLRNKLDPSMNAEEGACIRAVRRGYARGAGIPFGNAPDPKEIEAIARSDGHPHRQAALNAYRELGEVVGDAMGEALALVDGLAVIGGGLSKAWPLFMPAVVAELNAVYANPDGKTVRRLASEAFNLEDAAQRRRFMKGKPREIVVPGTRRKIKYDALRRVGVGVSRLGTSEAVAVGAYSYALRKLDEAAAR